MVSPIALNESDELPADTSAWTDPRSFLGVLSSVVQSSNITVLIWAGDADFNCNWMGCLASANAIQYSGTTTFASKAVSSYTVNGVTKGEFKSVGNLSWLRVYQAGHEVPYYREYCLSTR